MRIPPQAVIGGSSLVHLHQEISHGAAAPYADNDPLDHCPGASALLDLNCGNCMICKISLVPAEAGRDAEVWLGALVLLARRRSRQPGCFASGESQGIIRGGKVNFSPSDFPGLSWARSPQTFRNPSAAGGACRSIPTTLIRWMRVQGPQDPGAGLGARSPQRLLLVGLEIRP